MINYADFNDWINLDRFNEICTAVYSAPVLNESGNRFTKEKWILTGLEIVNHKQNIKYVDKRDYDLQCSSWSTPLVEVKTGNHIIATPTKGKIKKYCGVIVKNKQSGLKVITDLNKEFDHLMIVNIGTRCIIAFIDYATVLKYLITLPDRFIVKIPTEELNIIYNEPNIYKEHNIDFDPRTTMTRILRENYEA